MSHGRRIRRAVSAVLLAAVAFAVAGEVLARATGILDRLNGYSRLLYRATDDPELPYVLRPGIAGTVRGVPVRVNALGLRGPETTPRPAPGVERILALGDSATFGEGVREEDTFPVRLRAELAARGWARVEVLNGGVHGYNTEAARAFLRERGAALGPSTIVLAFNLNDYDPTPVIGPLGILTLDRDARVSTWSPANVSEFWLLLRWLVRTRTLPWQTPAVPEGWERGPGERYSRLDRYVAALRKRWWAEPTPERWAAMVAALRGLRDEARAHGARLLVAVIPDGDQLGTEVPDLTPQTKLRTVCDELGLECLDLHPAFAAARGDLHLDPMHPNAAGHAVIAHALADRLAGPGGLRSSSRRRTGGKDSRSRSAWGYRREAAALKGSHRRGPLPALDPDAREGQAYTEVGERRLERLELPRRLAAPSWRPWMQVTILRGLFLTAAMRVVYRLRD